MSKSLALDARGTPRELVEHTGKNAANEDTSRTWSFADADQAEKHAAQFADVPQLVAFADQAKAAREAREAQLADELAAAPGVELPK